MELNILSGSDIAPIKGIKEPRLKTSANEVSTVKINNKKNCFFLKLEIRLQNFINNLKGL